jgi:hypothetical protein
MEFYAAMKKNEMLSFTGKWMELENIILRKTKQNKTKHCQSHWIKKEDPTICYLQETHFIDRNKHWLMVKGWKKISQAYPS